MKTFILMIEMYNRYTITGLIRTMVPYHMVRGMMYLVLPQLVGCHAYGYEVCIFEHSLGSSLCCQIVCLC